MLNIVTEENGILLDAYNNNKPLNQNLRKALVKIIVKNFIEKNIKMTVNVCDDLSNQIVNMFKSEPKVRNINHWFIKIKIY